MKKVAILIDEMFEDAEFIYPYYRLIEAGMSVDIAAEKKISYTGKRGTTAKATLSLDELDSEAYAGVYIPGGYAPDRLRRHHQAVSFVQSVYAAGKPVCAVCHGPSLLIAAEILKGKRVTAFASIKDDIEKSGALYTAKSVELDGNLLTARDPKSLPEMMRSFLLLLDT